MSHSINISLENSVPCFQELGHWWLPGGFTPWVVKVILSSLKLGRTILFSIVVVEKIHLDTNKQVVTCNHFGL